jgi:eukaryotic-like serine/threonine-protein kinase
MARDDEEATQIEAIRNVWGDEPPSRGSAPFAWGEEPPPRSPAVEIPQESTPAAPMWGEEPPTRDQLIGMKLGEYELRSRIGVGGMGFVYDGIQPLIGKRVAVKVLRPELAQAPEQVARLLAEARAVNAIRHRGIIDIFGFGQVPDGRQYIVMEFLDGQPLDAYLAEKIKLPPTEALSILDEVLAALGAAHGAGVVHRDLKPSNIFLVREPGGTRYVKLLDFGLAKQGQSGASTRTAQTRTDMVVGTPEYMAPEQARGQAVGPMTDLYAMGVVTFEMVTGRLPFIGTSPVDLLMKHVDARPPRPSEFVPELPPALDAFILQMLTKDPEARPSSADALRQQLHRLRRTMVRPTRAQNSPVVPANGAAAPARAHTPAPSPATEPVTIAAAPPAAEAPKPAPAPAPAAAPQQQHDHPTAPNETVKKDGTDSVRTTAQAPSPHGISPAEARAAGLHSPMRRIVPIALAAVALLGAAGVLLFRNAGTSTQEVKPPAVATPPETPTPPQPTQQTQPGQQTPPPAPTPTPPNTAVNPPPVNPPPVNPPPVNPPPANPPPSTSKRPGGSGTHSSGQKEVLMTRVELLERDMNGLIQSGQIKDPKAARYMFTKIRSGAEAANSAEDRRNVSDLIKLFESSYLNRK